MDNCTHSNTHTKRHTLSYYLLMQTRKHPQADILNHHENYIGQLMWSASSEAYRAGGFLFCRCVFWMRVDRLLTQKAVTRGPLGIHASLLILSRSEGIVCVCVFMFVFFWVLKPFWMRTLCKIRSNEDSFESFKDSVWDFWTWVKG